MSKDRRVCEFEGCTHPHVAKGCCRGHYSQLRRGLPLRPLGTPYVPPVERECSFDGCSRKHASKGYCDAHYRQFRRGGIESLRVIGLQVSAEKKTTKCSFDPCDLLAYCKGLCHSHYNQKNEGRELKELGPYRGRGARILSCPSCGKSFKARLARSKFCSKTCSAKGQMAPLTSAYLNKDWKGVLKCIENSSAKTASGCWEWGGRMANGYPISSSHKVGKIHRVAVEASLGRPLGPESVHHACANTVCVNPNHLQLISQKENIAEMHERNFYLRRIAELEDALRSIKPDHHVLRSVADNISETS